MSAHAREPQQPDIPPLTGLRVVVTGANSGLGLQTSLALAAHGAAVTMACRDTARGRAALDRVRRSSRSDAVTLARLDLADLSSVHAFAASWEGPLEVLVNNAGVMAVPQSRTADGFEMQLGTNHLGHFALTGLLMPALRSAPAARVVTVASTAHRIGRIDLDDLQGERRYSPWRAYGQSKLANLLFTRELDRRMRSQDASIVAVAAHPGLAATNLSAGMETTSVVSRAMAALFRLAESRISQTDAAGALPVLYAATMPDVAGGEYFGPGGAAQNGPTVRVAPSARARDDAMAARLWEVSEELTGVRY